MLKRFFAVLVTLFVILVVGWFTMQRPNLSSEALGKRYAYSDSQYLHLAKQNVIVHFRDFGVRNGKVILLIHGFSSSMHTWDGITDKLAEKFRVITLDLPGHGLTQGPDDASRVSLPYYTEVVGSFLAALKIDRANLIGNSMGGHISWAYALTHPQNIETLTLLGASGVKYTPDETQNAPLIFRLVKNKTLSRALKNFDLALFVRPALRDAFVDETKVTPSMVTRYVNLSRIKGQRAILLNLLNAPISTYSFSDLEKLKTPSLIIHGGQDNLVPIRHAHIFNDTLSNSKLMTLNNIGHLPHEEAPEIISNALINFFTEALTQPTSDPENPE